ncbi:MAG TPA: alkaline phosphatase family protein, partial [Chloroflexota bacterium]|nr:alkaline phosphatase family protein [Chloroflexota bacterium]
MRFRGIVVVAPMLVALALINTFPQVASAITHRSGFLRWTSPGQLATTTPIKHLVVLFQENVSFDHYFGTYPHAANLKGETKWFGAKKTPKITGLTPALLTHNPNLHNPIRLDAKQAVTCDQSHTYSAEQHAENGGRMNEFVQYTSGSAGTKYRYCPKGIVMGHYDGNVVTALWNYAQHYVLSDNSWGTTFGPSTVGAINLASGDTGTALCGPAPATINTSPCTSTPPATNGPRGTVFSDADPYYDQCSNTFNPTPAQDIALTGANIGTLLDRGKVSWGWFQGGFGNCMSASPPKNGPVLGLKAQGATPAQDPADQTTDYSPHHDPFQ